MMNELKKFATTEAKRENVLPLVNQIPLVLANIILDKSLIKKNIDLKPISLEISGNVYRDYLFQSRTALFARMTKDVYINLERDRQYDLVIRLQNVVNTLVNTDNEDTNQNSIINESTPTPKESAIKKWQRIIEAD